MRVNTEREGNGWRSEPTILVGAHQGRGFRSGVMFRKWTEAPPGGGATVLQHHSLLEHAREWVCVILPVFLPRPVSGACACKGAGGKKWGQREVT